MFVVKLTTKLMVNHISYTLFLPFEEHSNKGPINISTLKRCQTLKMLVHDFSSQQRYQKITLIKLYTLNFLNSLPQTYTGDPHVRPWLNQGPTLYLVAQTKDPRVRPWLNQGPTLYFVAQTACDKWPGTQVPNEQFVYKTTPQ